MEFLGDKDSSLVNDSATCLVVSLKRAWILAMIYASEVMILFTFLEKYNKIVLEVIVDNSIEPSD